MKLHVSARAAIAFPFAVAVFLTGAARAAEPAAAPDGGVLGAAPTTLDPATLRVYMSGSYMPLHGRSGDTRVGLEAELAELLGKKLGKRIVYYDRKSTGLSALDAVRKEKVDVALSGITPTPERAAMVDFTRPYVSVPLRAACVRSDVGPYALRLAGRTIAVPAGVVETQVAGLKANVVVMPSMAEAVKQATVSLIDFVVGEEPELAPLARERGLRLCGLPVGTSPIALAARKGHGAGFDAVLGELEPDLVALRARWSAYFSTFETVSVGDRFGCALTDVKTLACFGDESAGLGQITPPAGEFTTVIVAGSRACALRSNGTEACWGEGGPLPAPQIDALAAIRDNRPGYRCVLKDDKHADCWSRAWGDPFPRGAPTGEFLVVSAGVDYACGVDGRSLLCWGRDPPKGLPDVAYRTVSVGSSGGCAILWSGELLCWGTGPVLEDRVRMGGGVDRPVQPAKRPLTLAEPVLVAVCDALSGHWQLLASLDPVEGLVDIRETQRVPRQPPDLFVGGDRAGGTISVGQKCSDYAAATSVPVTRYKGKLKLEQSRDGTMLETFEEKARLLFEGPLAGVLHLVRYTRTGSPRDCNQTRDCTGLILEWDRAPGQPASNKDYEVMLDDCHPDELIGVPCAPEQ